MNGVPLNNIYPLGSKYISVGALINAFIGPMFTIASFLMLFYLFFAGWKYLTSGGNKEELAKARAMVLHAIIGLVMLVLLFIVIVVVPQMLGFNFSIVGQSQ